MKKLINLIKEMLLGFRFWRLFSYKNHQQKITLFRPKKNNIITIQH